jgi:hypothetical protein
VSWKQTVQLKMQEICVKAYMNLIRHISLGWIWCSPQFQNWCKRNGSYMAWIAALLFFIATLQGSISCLRVHCSKLQLQHAQGKKILLLTNILLCWSYIFLQVWNITLLHCLHNSPTCFGLLGHLQGQRNMPSNNEAAPEDGLKGRNM